VGRVERLPWKNASSVGVPWLEEVPLVTQVAPQRARHDRRHAARGAHSRPAPPVFPEPAPPQGRRLRGRHATGYDTGFSGVVTWTVIGSILPGAGLVAAGRRRAGWFLLLLTLLLGAALVAFLVLGDAKSTALSVAFDVNDLMQVTLALCGAALLWALVVLTSHASLRRFTVMTAPQRLLSTVLVASIVAGGGLVAAKAASISLIQRGVLQDVTANGTQVDNGGKPRSGQADPWANAPRVNVLLIGSDAGADREGVRTDSVILASIDTHTGDAVLFGIPRNLQHVPFPEGTPMAQQYPDGFYCQDPKNPCLFNALWQYGVEHAGNQYYRNFKNPGLQATIDGVQAVTGLPVNEYVLLDLKGFASFINAIGGVDVTVKRPIPVAGHENAAGQQVGVKGYIRPGRRHLNGYYALWFARSRSDSSDFDRMARQRCLIGAVTQQVNPVTVARSFPALAEAIRQNISMSIRLDDLGAWVTLAERVQKGRVRSLPFVEGVISTVHPDFDRIHSMVQQGLEPPSSTPSATKKPRRTTSGSGSATRATSDTAVDVKEACG
jgi:polyisoprenyl-teichoic acid--peptidoglycan teichoic acid transferase